MNLTLQLILGDSCPENSHVSDVSNDPKLENPVVLNSTASFTLTGWVIGVKDSDLVEIHYTDRNEMESISSFKFFQRDLLII